MRNLILIFALAFAAYAQTELSDKTFNGKVDASGATKTLPHRSGTGSPVGRDACAAIGETYFQRDATAGSNTFASTTTGGVGVCVWSLQGGAGGSAASVFTGSTASTVASSATPAFSLADVSVKSPIRFNISPVVNVTAPTITNKTAGAHFYIAVTTDGTHTWSWNSIISDNVCTIYTAAAATTVAEITVDPDGSTLHGGSCIGGPVGLLTLAPTGSACGTPASGSLCVWLDTTDNTLKVKDSSANVYAVPKTAGSRTANQFVTHIPGTGIAATALIVDADVPSTLTGKTVDGVSPTTFGFLDPTSSVQTQLNAKISSASTDTLTNKTLDAEGTGNVITMPFPIWLPGAGCNNATAASFWDLPTSTPAVATCVTGSNTQKGVLAYADTSGGFSAQTEYLLPSDFTGAIDARIIWSTSATSGNAKWSLSTVCTDVAASATDDAAFNTASTVTTAAPGTANRLQTSAITGVTATGCSAGNFLHLKLFRDGNDGSDTISATANVVGVEIKIRRAM